MVISNCTPDGITAADHRGRVYGTRLPEGQHQIVDQTVVGPLAQAVAMTTDRTN
jgi:hypothetical protein